MIVTGTGLKAMGFVKTFIVDKSLRRNLPLCLCKRRVWCWLESPEIPARLNAACADGLHDDGARVEAARPHRKAKEEYSKSLGF